MPPRRDFERVLVPGLCGPFLLLCLLFRSSEEGTELLGDFVAVLGYGVRVPAERDTGAGVAEAGLDGLHVHSCAEEHGGLGVPELVGLEPV